MVVPPLPPHGTVDVPADPESEARRFWCGMGCFVFVRLFFFFFTGLGVKVKASQMPGKCSTTELPA